MSITLQEANATFGSIDSACNSIILNGLYLPKRQSQLQPYIINLKWQINFVGYNFKIQNSGKCWLGFDEVHHPRQNVDGQCSLLINSLKARYTVYQY
ncbi:unnamed protein product [Paramecium octaurelia]|uniref:Uncharacterized protein n=1 Tax=Paramecium octaurelia TaxID=43137 RepID=A0A8S1WFK5_PAROT|nr:unnamed protein product [Paramecium octaurelia]